MAGGGLQKVTNDGRLGCEEERGESQGGSRGASASNSGPLQTRLASDTWRPRPPHQAFASPNAAPSAAGFRASVDNFNA